MTIVIDIISVLIFVLLVGGVLFYGKNGLLQDISDAMNKPYSFSRVQASWWTIVIIGSFLYIFALNESTQVSTTYLNIFNSTALILLGISAGTLGIGRVIDDSQERKDKDRHQNLPSDGFFADILSDSGGISIHRVQCLIFNLIYGLIFVYQVVKHGKMPDFSELELALIGISSATYIGLKSAENLTNIESKG